jgi:peroxiredoxin
MKIKVNEKIPKINFFYLRENNTVAKITSTELLANQKAIVIGVPGAFTKVCSAQHLPGYVENFEEAKKRGITKIICVSVNDPNVMSAWGKTLKVENKIFMAADPYCEFTKAIGAEIDRIERGLGMRSERYTMMVEDNIVKIIMVEEDTAHCEISAAKNFIKAI